MIRNYQIQNFLLCVQSNAGTFFLGHPVFNGGIQRGSEISFQGCRQKEEVTLSTQIILFITFKKECLLNKKVLKYVGSSEVTLAR